MKKTIQIDLDGVLNTYIGNYNESEIPPIADGAIKFLKKLEEHYYLILFSSREPKKVEEWVKKYEIGKYFTKITNVKQAAYLTIDDRCICFNGDFVKTIKEIENFKVWWR